MKTEQKLVEIHEYRGDGYRPLIDFGAWRVALLKYCDELRPENIETMQRHEETDEVFVLLRGKCLLFAGDGKEEAGDVHIYPMEPLKLFNVKKGVWHTHSLSEEAVVLIVENRDTTSANSPVIRLNDEQRRKIQQAAVDFGLLTGKG